MYKDMMDTIGFVSGYDRNWVRRLWSGSWSASAGTLN